MLVVFKTCCV